MAFRDIDYSLRVNGDLSVPSHSFKVGSNITLTSADGKVSATQFAGNGALLTNLSSSAMTDVLLLNGTRPMTGSLTLSSNNQVYFKDSGHFLRYQSIGADGASLEGVRISGYSGVELTRTNGGTELASFRLAAAKINAPLTVSTSVTSTTINATGNLQENGTNLSAKYEPKGTLHDDRYYTETEMDTKLGTKSNTGHTHLWADLTDKPTTFPATSHTHDDRYYTEAEMDTKLNAKMGYGDVVMNTNPFGGKQLFINSVNNAMFRAESRWVVTGGRYLISDDSLVATLNETSLANLFNGDYENSVAVPAGEYVKVHIDFGGVFPGYPYGNIYLSHYYVEHSQSAKMRVYCTYEPHGIGWHEVAFTDYVKNGSNMISIARNGKYAITQMEFLIYASPTAAASPTQLDWQLDRPGSTEMPLVDKYRNNNLYSQLSFRDINNQLNANITASGNANFTTLTVAGVAASLVGHTHDDRYFTETEVNTLFTNERSAVDTKLATKSPTGHGHVIADVAGLDTALTGKSNTGHTHLWAELTDKPVTFPATAHTHDDRYYTETEMDTKLSGKSDTAHLHDDRYYTELEVDGLLDEKSDAAHVHTFGELTDKPTTLAGYGVTDAAPVLHSHDDRYYTETEINTKLSGKSDTTHSHAFGDLTSRPTTLGGYGITDAAAAAHSHAFSALTAKPTTLAGYGITDAAASTHNHDSVYAAAGHDHDTDYADIAHAHDDRYYTETEMDAKVTTLNNSIAGKSDTGHAHSWTEVTGKPTTFAPSAHSHAIADVTGLQGALDGKSATSHNHDAAYAAKVHNHDTAYAAIAHNHDSSYAKRGTRNESVRALDKRVWTPTEVSTGTGEVQFAFTSLNNDNASPFADALVLSTYPDGSAGGNNVLLAAKNGSGLYLRYGSWNAAEWSWTKKLAFDEDKVSKTTSVSTGAGLTGGGDLSTSRTLSVTFGTAAGTVAEGNHGHSIANVSGLQAALDGKSADTHTHAFSALTSRPTTLSGYGITDAATSTHHHNGTYLSLAGGTLAGALTIAGTLRDSRITTGNTQLLNTNGTTIYVGNPATGLSLESSTNPIAYIAGTGRTLWHTGNFTPADKADASALTTHTGNADIHKSWGKWATSGAGQDMTVDGKRAVVHVINTNKLTLNYGGDFTNGVEIVGSLTNNGNAVWHAGNFTPGGYITTGNGQSVGSGFTVKGRFLVGNVSGISGDAILYDDAANATIHLDGNSSGIESSSATKIHLLGNGNATFKETVTVRNLTATTGAIIPTLSVTTINDISEKNFTKNQSIADNTGWGILSGLEGLAYGGELHVEPGVGYTKSGRRVEVLARAKVAMTPAPQSGTRYDILHIKGPSASTEEAALGYFEGVVGETAAAALANGALSDAVILATVKREMAQASITQADIDNSVRDSGTVTGRKPLYVDAVTKDVKVRYELHTQKVKEGGQYLSALYAGLTGGNTFTSNQKFNGRVHISATGTLSSNAGSANYGLRVGTESDYIAMDGNEILSTNELYLAATTSMTITAPSGIELVGKVKAAKNATTLTIPAGSRSVTWTHNYGAITYAVVAVPNSFERHVRWTSKSANSVVIEIDDTSSQETLVDCILIGY